MKVKGEIIENVAQLHPPTFDSKAQKGSSKLVVEIVVWFATIVGLKNWRIDPLRDLRHITDLDLEEIFEYKVNQKSYCYLNYQPLTSRTRIQKLHLVLFQVKDMPDHIPQSFAYVVVSEVLHHNIIHWAKLAIEKWRGKDILEQCSIIPNERREAMPLKEVVLGKL